MYENSEEKERIEKLKYLFVLQLGVLENWQNVKNSVSSSFSVPKQSLFKCTKRMY